MTLNKKFSKDKKKNNSKISKQIQSKIKKKDKNSKNKSKSPYNNAIELKRSSSQISSFISRYENNIRNNKTINMDDKKENLMKNKFFFSSYELGNISDILNKKDLTMSENKYFNNMNNIKRKDFNESKDIIKVNTKIVKDGSSRCNNKLLYNNSKSETKNNLNNSNKNKLLNTKLYKKVKEKNIKNIKYNISNTQKKFFINEKFNFLFRKLKKIFLSKIFLIIKKRYKHKFDRFRKSSNLKISKTKSKILNLSSKKSSMSKNKEKKNNINNNMFKQSYKNKNLDQTIGINGLNRPPSKISIKYSDNYKVNQIHIQHKQKSVKIKLNQNITINNLQIKKNKTLNESKLKVKKNKQNNNNSHKKINNKKSNSYKKEIKKNIFNDSKEKHNFIINRPDKELMKILGKNNNYNNIQNENIYYYNTEISTSLINSIYKMNNSGRNCRVYENCLIEGNKFYQHKIGGAGLKEKNYPLMDTSPIRNINSPFLKKNVSPKKGDSKTKEKINLNIKVNNSNNRCVIYDKNINIQKCETNPINNNLYDLFNNDLLIKNIFVYWKNYSTKKKILKKFLIKNKIYEIIKKSQRLIFKIILKILHICLLKKYFHKYKNIYYKRKIFQNLRYIKNKGIKYINIPICQRNSYDIINNININNYIDCSDLNRMIRKRSQSPVILSKLVMLSSEKSNNNLNEIKYTGNIFDNQNKNLDEIKYNLKSFYNEDFISFAQTDRLHDNFNSNNLIKKSPNQKIINLNGLSINHKKKQNNIIRNNYYNDDNETEASNKNKKNALINQVNQLRMVFNLLEQQENRTNNLYNCFHRWLFEAKINLRNNNKNIFWSFSGNNNLSIEVDNNQKIYNRYSVNTYKDKDINNTCLGKKNFGIGKYTPVRGIKNFRSKTSQKMANNQNIFDYNDLDDIRRNCNFNASSNSNISSSLMNIKNINKNDMNMVYHKKKLITPNLQCNYNNCFLEYNNNSYLTNYDNFKSMNITSFDFYKRNDCFKDNYYIYNNNINISNKELNNSIYSSYQEKNIGKLYIIPYKSSTYLQPNMIQEKKIDLKKMNRIEEKEINFALYKTKNSQNKSSDINNINKDYFGQNAKINTENNKIIYRQGKNEIKNNINNANCNKRIFIYTNNNKWYNEKNIKYKKRSTYNSARNRSVNFGKFINLEKELIKDNEKRIIKSNFSFSYFENKYQSQIYI